MNSLQIEKLWPWLGASAVVVIWWVADKPFPKTPDSLFGAAATVASVFASFLGVSKAIILTIKGTKTYQILERANYTHLLFAYLRAGIYSSVLFSSLSILGFFIHNDSEVGGHQIYNMFCLLWVAAGASALFTYMRIANILFRLLRQPEVTAQPTAEHISGMQRP
jgi:hypothetical protein